MVYMYTWGNTPLDVAQDSYLPMYVQESSITEIEIIPDGTTPGAATSVLQIGARKRKRGRVQIFTKSLAVCLALESDMTAGTVRAFSDGTASMNSVIVGISLSNKSVSGYWFVTIEFLEAS